MHAQKCKSQMASSAHNIKLINKAIFKSNWCWQRLLVSFLDVIYHSVRENMTTGTQENCRNLRLCMESQMWQYYSACCDCWFSIINSWFTIVNSWLTIIECWLSIRTAEYDDLTAPIMFPIQCILVNAFKQQAWGFEYSLMDCNGHQEWPPRKHGYSK